MDLDTLAEHLSDQEWRLNNLYTIRDDGKELPFRFNYVQRQFYEQQNYRNIILKARQQGFSTLIQLILLDTCLFHPNTAAGVIAKTVDDATALFRDKIMFAYDRLPAVIKAMAPVVRSNTTELYLGNGSSIRVGTSLRGGTNELLHISEMGAISAHYPERAREIVTGALGTVKAGNQVWVESTAEGIKTRFHELCLTAMEKKNRGDEITPLDFQFYFSPWWRHPTYTIDPEGVLIAPELDKYFDDLTSVHGVPELSAGQRAWYVKTKEVYKDDMGREYPSYPDEAFAQSTEGSYYYAQMAAADKDGRVTDVAFNPMLEVETWWDLGRNDPTSIWFVQRSKGGNELRIINYFQANNESLPFYAARLKDFATQYGYRYSRHVLPHDAANTDISVEVSRKRVLEDLGVTPVIIAPKLSVQEGIDAARVMLSRCYFDQTKCSGGLHALRQYRREYDRKNGIWLSTPRHDQFSHAADAFRYGAVAPEPNNAYANQDYVLPNRGAV